MLHFEIAICDDDVVFSSALEERVRAFFAIRQFSCAVDVYNDSETLCRRIRDNGGSPYDLILLDIEMPGQSGLQVSSLIRDVCGDNVTQIVYVSSKQDYAMELFAYRPIHFLVKPVGEERLTKVLDTFLRLATAGQQKFTYKKGADYVSVSLSDIMYFEHRGRKIILHAGPHTDEFYGSLEKVYASLKDGGFLTVHKSYLVNASHVKLLSHEYLVTDDDALIPISRKHQTEIRRKYAALQSLT